MIDWKQRFRFQKIYKRRIVEDEENKKDGKEGRNWSSAKFKSDKGKPGLF